MNNLTKKQIELLFKEFSKYMCVEVVYRYGEAQTPKLIKKTVEQYKQECIKNNYIIEEETEFGFDYITESDNEKYSYFVYIVPIDFMNNCFVEFINFVLNQKNV